MLCVVNQGHKKATVLPLPVLAIPIISRPLSAVGIALKLNFEFVLFVLKHNYLFFFKFQIT